MESGHLELRFEPASERLAVSSLAPSGSLAEALKFHFKESVPLLLFF